MTAPLRDTAERRKPSLHFTIHTEVITNPWTGTTHANSYAVDTTTGHRIAGTDGATPEDSRFFVKHWYQGAKEAAEAEAAA